LILVDGLGSDQQADARGQCARRAHGPDAVVRVEQDATRQRGERTDDVNLEGGELGVLRRLSSRDEHASQRRALIHGEHREAPVGTSDGIETGSVQGHFLRLWDDLMTALSDCAVSGR
jgi:hypothetical protein